MNSETRAAYRQQRQPTPITTVGDDPQVAAAVVLRALRSLQHKRSCGAFVYVDPLRQVYFVAETRAIAPVWLRDRFDWLVGFYCTRTPTDTRVPILRPTLEGIAEDLAGQIADMATRVATPPTPGGLSTASPSGQVGITARSRSHGEPRCGGRERLPPQPATDPAVGKDNRAGGEGEAGTSPPAAFADAVDASAEGRNLAA